ncbi:MAG: malectin domain-containing carbohydrate-binding protein [Planctomycetota bacterium]|nr:malectin domain-containing carbohydrate-binding protein [Planctomycetota bacterium]
MRHVTMGMALVAAAMLAAGLVGCGPQKTGAAAGKLVLRVNCAADKEYTDETGAKWLPDQVWKEGAPYGAVEGQTILREGLKITGTKAPEVYLTERYSMKAYRFDVPPGKYAVRLHFAETFPGIVQDGPRVFTVAIQGKPVLTDLDVMKAAGGFGKPLVKEFKGVAVAADKKLMIEFTAKTQNSEINGIEIIGE